MGQIINGNLDLNNATFSAEVDESKLDAIVEDFNTLVSTETNIFSAISSNTSSVLYYRDSQAQTFSEFLQLSTDYHLNTLISTEDSRYTALSTEMAEIKSMLSTIIAG